MGDGPFPWWRLGDWEFRMRTRWTRLYRSGPPAEYRWFPGPRLVVAMVRAALWPQVFYGEVGPADSCRGLSPEQWRIVEMSFLDRAAPIVEGKSRFLPFVDPEFAKSYPAVYEYMTASVYPDGTTRKTSTLTLFCEDGQLKVCLSDKDRNAVLFSAGKGLKQALGALEGLLESDATPWRVGRGEGPGGQKKRGG